MLAAKDRGEHVYCEFNGHKLYSDTVTIDSAHKEVLGYTKEEYEQRANQQRVRIEMEAQAREQREQNYKRMVAQTRIPGQDVVITMPLVVEGLKFIAENKMLSQEELIKGLLDFGCNFTFEDVNKQFPDQYKLYEGMKKGELSTGASVIINIRDSEYGRAYCNEALLGLDNESSVYHFIRVTTGDENYTKNNLDLNNTTGRKKIINTEYDL